MRIYTVFTHNLIHTHTLHTQYAKSDRQPPCGSHWIMPIPAVDDENAQITSEYDISL